MPSPVSSILTPSVFYAHFFEISFGETAPTMPRDKMAKAPRLLTQNAGYVIIIRNAFLDFRFIKNGETG